MQGDAAPGDAGPKALSGAGPKALSSASRKALSAASRKALSAASRKALRGRAHALRPVVHVGEGGLSDGVLTAAEQALLDHELIKVRLHEPDDKKALARALAEATQAALCGLVGHTVILYRAHPEHPRADLAQLAGTE